MFSLPEAGGRNLERKCHSVFSEELVAWVLMAWQISENMTKPEADMIVLFSSRRSKE
jgi:hypothetical protein